MAETLDQIILLNVGLTGCLPPEIGALDILRVFDVSFNSLVGKLPDEVADMVALERLVVADNQLRGDVSECICDLPRLMNFTYSFNYFTGEAPECLRLRVDDDRFNCIPGRPMQRSPGECAAFLENPVDCDAYGCLESPQPPSEPEPEPSPEYPWPDPGLEPPPAPCLICIP